MGTSLNGPSSQSMLNRTPAQPPLPHLPSRSVSESSTVTVVTHFGGASMTHLWWCPTLNINPTRVRCKDPCPNHTLVTCFRPARTSAVLSGPGFRYLLPSWACEILVQSFPRSLHLAPPPPGGHTSPGTGHTSPRLPKQASHKSSLILLVAILQGELILLQSDKVQHSPNHIWFEFIRLSQRCTIGAKR